MRTSFLLLLLVLPAIFAIEDPEQCDEFDCWSKKDLLKALDRYKNQLDTVLGQMSQASKPSVSRLDVFGTDATDAPTCSICNSAPCQNGGTCLVDPSDPWNKWTCECFGNYTGSNCETLVKCEPTTCGVNAQCSVSNHQANCVCQLGYSGNPKTGCTLKTKKSCLLGDPHYTTFDNLLFDYQGTCPLVFSQPCTSLTGGYDNFKVVHKNEGPTTVSWVTQVDVHMFGQEIHFDRNKKTMYFNKVQVGYPYYWPSSANRTITMEFQGSTMSVTSNQQVQVTFTTSGTLCLIIPDVPEFFGEKVLCGVGGNYDNNPNNDVVYRNGTIYPVTGNNPQTIDPIGFNRAEDSWIESDFFLTSGDGTCATGETYNNNSNCNLVTATQACLPIQSAMNGTGPFALCQGMGNVSISSYYDNCIFDVCHNTPACTSLYDFVQQCMTVLPDTDLGPWRTTTGCPRKCGPHSTYSSCTSSCPATCSDHDAPSSCDEGCVDGCSCDYGFVVDNSITSGTVCIPIQECGCTDPEGNSHGADEPWLNPNCTVAAECKNGTYTDWPVQCNQYAYCGPDASYETACQCDPGFRGDGFNCTDINECVEDPSSCGQDQGLGTCTNTIGSYNCTCNLYQMGRDCQNFMPTRHCADLIRYWNETEDGVYTLHLPQVEGDHGNFTDLDVYCDMTTEGGGWTLMSHDNASLMVGKYYEEYEEGFGDPEMMSVWLGLKVIAYMTKNSTTSLRVVIYRCPMRNSDAQTTDCTYPTFSVNGPETNYTVNIPQVCEGSENAVSQFDGWVRWQPGNAPSFSTLDQHDSLNCPSHFQSTGWWYDSSRLCGSADLNGARYECDNVPGDAFTYIEWGGNPIGDAWMYLRPADFPNY